MGDLLTPSCAHGFTQQHLGLLEVSSVKVLGEPAVYGASSSRVVAR